MSAPIDHAARRRFTSELDRNFSVVAAAGSGKTRAITERILSIATSTHALDWLPRLVVVTYTLRAAGEMQQRARQQILEAGVSLEVLAAFNRAFFGTIHSFSVKLLRHHGHHLGLPGKFELLTDDDELWAEFVQKQTIVGRSLRPEQRSQLLRFVPVRQLMQLGRIGGAEALAAAEPGDCPEPDFSRVLAAVGKGNSVKTIERSQAALRDWRHVYQDASSFVGAFPKCESAPLEETWNQALEPIREWVRCCSLKVAAEVEAAWRAFRLGKGVFTYDDQVALAGALLRHPEAARRIREKEYRVILDEAQDTDPSQFSMLLELARPAAALGDWLATRTDPPRPGHFCMVGDFQQSIFGERADLAHYQRVHDTLLATGAGESLEFSVTFRLDQRQVDFVNETFSKILGTDGQVAFVNLNTRPTVLPGQIVRFELDAGTDGAELSDRERARIEARQLAAWLRDHGLEKLRAGSWRDVAILCPRKDWFRPLRDALRAARLDVQIQSERDLKGDSPAYAWLTALVVIMAEPRHAYEIAGVLREVFGLADADLAEFCEGYGDRFQIARSTGRNGVVAETLGLLAGIRERMAELSLHAAVRELVSAAQLRDRLLALPREEFENVEAELDDLLTLAAAAEAERKTLAQFAETLRTNFSAVREVRATTRNAIQLITCHKAKGSEWQAVIVPFLSRQIRNSSPRYPRLVREPKTGRTIVALGSDYIDEDAKQAIKREQRQEMERLLYVALTRAKHTLVIAHDHALFPTKRGVSETSQTHLLGWSAKGANVEAFNRLPPALAACSTTAAQQLAAGIQNAPRIIPLSSCTGDFAARARDHAAHFLKRNPSALAEAVLPAEPAEPVETTRPRENPGTRYGTWWHLFVEELAWKESRRAWDAHFEQALADSPDAARSRAEWKLLRGNAEITALLSRKDVIAHTEMPFLWAMNERECLEGVIDLALFDPAARSWWILDWKTNSITAANAPELHRRYEPQLAAYWKAVGAMLGMPVRAAIYSTATGKWLPYEETALAKSWERICHNPAELESALAEE